MKEVQISGKTRGFEFGTYTFKLIAEETGINTVEGVFNALVPTEEDVKQINMSFMSSFCFCCAKHYALIKKEKIDFTEIDVAGWLDELGFLESSNIIQDLIKIYSEKNLKAPETGQ